MSGSLIGMADIDIQNSLSGWQYSSISVDRLNEMASEFSILQIMVDWSGSVGPFFTHLIEALKTLHSMCLKHPHKENVLVRVCGFSSKAGVVEVHGFLPLDSIDLALYDNMQKPYGATPLMDAHLNAIEALFQYGENLMKNQIICNSILFIISDGGENDSKIANLENIRKMNAKLKSGDPLESFTSVLLGINDAQCIVDLKEYKKDSEMDEYISFGDATPGNLAKMVHFISQSFSTVSQNVGSGSNSQGVTQAVLSHTF